MDLASGYWQIRVKEEHIEKTAIVTKSGLYEFVAMENVLCHLQWQTCYDCLDDIIVFSRDFSEHLLHLGQVFKRIKAA